LIIAHGNGGTVAISERPVAAPSIDGPTTGFAVQFVLLTALAATAGLGAAGWLTGTVYAVVVWVLLSRALRRSGMYSLGPANQVTLARAILVGGVAALVADSFRGPTHIVLLVTLAGIGLSLDAVDGQVARRTGSTTRLGARFDMEIDAVHILILSVFVARPLGLWVLAIGALRYAFVAAAWALPWLRAALPHRLSRKVVAATQGIALVVAASGVLPRPLAVAAVVLALASLCWSFGRDVRWLWQVRRVPAAPALRNPPVPAVSRTVSGVAGPSSGSVAGRSR
jgi:phosphatidylglycerophosphate synthase